MKLVVREILYFNLIIDEMSIKRKIDWDGKKYIEFVDLETSVANTLTFCEQDLHLSQFISCGATTNFCFQINNIF